MILDDFLRIHKLYKIYLKHFISEMRVATLGNDWKALRVVLSVISLMIPFNLFEVLSSIITYSHRVILHIVISIISVHTLIVMSRVLAHHSILAL